MAPVEKSLRYFGLAVVAAAACLLLAGEVGWILPETSDAWFGPLFKIGGICFLAGLLLSVLAPGLRWVRRGRCVRCEAPIERGQSYCRDHLRAAVNEARDHVHETRVPRARRR